MIINPQQYEKQSAVTYPALGTDHDTLRDGLGALPPDEILIDVFELLRVDVYTTTISPSRSDLPAVMWISTTIVHPLRFVQAHIVLAWW